MLNVKSYNEVCYDAIKEKIISKEYEPGKILNERKLSEEFGISRTPIREALLKLSFEGWIINEPYKKNQVREFDLRSIIEAQKVRESLEILAISEAIENLKEEDLKVLEAFIEEQRKNLDNYNEFIKIDRKFHDYIYHKSDNELLIELMGNINDIVRYFGLIAMESPKRSEEVLKEHIKILKALKEKNLKEVEKSMKYHMTMTEKSIKYRYENKI